MEFNKDPLPQRSLEGSIYAWLARIIGIVTFISGCLVFFRGFSPHYPPSFRTIGVALIFSSMVIYGLGYLVCAIDDIRNQIT